MVKYRKKSVNSIKPLEIYFLKENDHFSNKILKKYMNFCHNNDLDFNIKLIPTMLDQKFINASTILKPEAKGVDSQLCYLCEIISNGHNSFQNLENFTKSCIRDRLFFGISPLHALINFTNFVIYKVSTVINNFNIEEINNRLEESFKISFLEIKRGFGSKITGNVARNFFEKFDLFARTINLPIKFLSEAKSLLNLLRTSDNINLKEL